MSSFWKGFVCGTIGLAVLGAISFGAWFYFNVVVGFQG